MIKARKSLRYISVILTLAIVLSEVMPANAKYYFSEHNRETPHNFNEFLDICTRAERVQMLQALKDLPSLRDKYFGKLRGLSPLSNYTTDKNEASAWRPLKPSTFNEVMPETVLDAVDKGIIDRSAISSEAVRKALVYRAYNKLTYYFRGDDEVDYHGIVQWVARETDVDEAQVNKLSTFALEKKIAEKYFEALWDKLNTEQRKAMLEQLEKELGMSLPNKTAMLTMSGASVLAAWQAYVLGTFGPVFWTVFSTKILIIISTLLGWGVPMSIINGLLALAGPIGWAIQGVLLATSVYFLGSAEAETVSAFIMTVNIIKVNKWVK